MVLRRSFDQFGVQAIPFDSTYISVSDFYCDVSFSFALNDVFRLLAIIVGSITIFYRVFPSCYFDSVRSIKPRVVKENGSRGLVVDMHRASIIMIRPT